MGGNRKFKNERNRTSNDDTETSDSDENFSNEENLSLNAKIDSGILNLNTPILTRSKGSKLGNISKIGLDSISKPKESSKKSSNGVIETIAVTVGTENSNIDRQIEVQKESNDRNLGNKNNLSFLEQLGEKLKNREISPSEIQDKFSLVEPFCGIDTVFQNNSDISDEEEMIVETIDSGRKRNRSQAKSRSRSRSRSASKQPRRSRASDDVTPKQRQRSRSGSRSPKPKQRKSECDEDLRRRCQEDAYVQNLIKDMVAKQVAAKLGEQQDLPKQLKTVDNGEFANFQTNLNKTPVNNSSVVFLDNNGCRMKSPSDSTLYVPAVKVAKVNQIGSPPRINTENLINKFVNSAAPKDKNEIESNVNDILTELRLGAVAGKPQDRQDKPETQKPSTSRRQQPDNEDVVRSTVNRAILDAERFKASIQQPIPGINFNNPGTPRHDLEQLRQLRYLDDDDEFFHTTCHIDAQLKARIEKGEFVELEKLVQKRTQLEPEVEGRMQLVNKDGMSYFVKAIDRETKINNVTKWEQAFRVYSTIYCQANPNRSAEILQYVDVIHRAAKIFNWDNVARYDYVFRQLMAVKPHRSWAKIYTQMWNINLNEPIKRFQEQNGAKDYRGSGGNANAKRDNTCWRYNKNTCKFGKSCRFEHKCSYCGTPGHPVLNCHKKNGQKKQDKSEKGGK